MGEETNEQARTEEQLAADKAEQERVASAQAQAPQPEIQQPDTSAASVEQNQQQDDPSELPSDGDAVVEGVKEEESPSES